MEQDQDQENKQHVCKLCNKSFLSGRVLGGHMRSHRVKNSAKEDVSLVNSNLGNEGCYVQRESPKNSVKSSILNDDNDGVFSAEESVTCRICGKKFESPKSLNGHMRHHSAEERNAVRCKECGKGFKTVRSLTGHMRLHSLKKKESRTSSGPDSVVMAFSDPKTVKLVKRKRSNRIRCKVTDHNSSFFSLNESMNGFGTEQEDEEVAMCLLMLSRGASEWASFESVCESLDNDSLCFEAKSFSNEDIPSREGEIDDLDDVLLVKQRKAKIDKFDSLASDSMSKSFECGDYACDMVCMEENKIRLELAIVSFHQAVDSNNLELKDECGLTFCNTEIEKRIHDNLYNFAIDSDWNQDCKEEVSGLEHLKCSPANSTVVACDAEMRKDSFTEVTSSASDLDSKKTRFQCRICNRLFSTHHALGGHQTLHRTMKYSSNLNIEHCKETTIPSEKIDLTSAVSKPDDIENSVEEGNGMTIAGYHLKKSNKNHQCPICAKFFMTGQALGGHKRAHITKAREEQNMTMQQDVPDICDALDLNLPAMVDTEASNESGFEPWQQASSYEHESLLHVVATT